jgi:hypothetical protein
MTKAAIFSFISVSETSMVASTKIARYIRDELQLPLIWTEKIGDYTGLDVLVLIAGAYGFCKHLEPLAQAIVSAKRIVFVQNDYTVIAPINDGKAKSPFRKAFVDRRLAGKSHLDFWTTCQKESQSSEYSYYINWNCLSMQKPPRMSTVTNDVVYYGSFRTGRMEFFDNYFMRPKCRMIISSPSSKFKQRYTSSLITHCGVVDDLIKWLSERGLGLYLEDKRSTKQFHSPPNRFYEMLSAGLPMAFPTETGPMLSKAGYDTSSFILRAVGDNTLLNMMDRRDKIKDQQNKLWWDKAMQEKLGLNKRLHEAWNHLQKGI